MKKIAMMTGLMLALVQTAQAKDEFANAKEAEAMVGKAVAAIKANPQKTFEEITKKDAKWVDRDLYVVVYGIDGKVIAHGANDKMVGKELIGLKDPDGKAFVQERVDLAKSKGKFWQDYKFSDPITKKALPKQMYCEKLDDNVVCGGIYKR
jgi:signal transduction histidine kinase